MKKQKIKVFLAPHNDDEALYGAFTIMRERPLVVVATDSQIQYVRGDGITAEERRNETLAAMGRIGAEVRFLGILDNEFTKQKFIEALKSQPDIMDAGLVFAPMIEGGNPIHDIVGEVASELFTNVLHYPTYTRSAPSIGDIVIAPTQVERELKNVILEEYHSQKTHKYNKSYFDRARTGSEYFNSSKYAKITGIKEQALKNIIDARNIFNNLDIPFCLMDGTLLGAYRDGDFINGDYDDTDIGFDESYADKVPLIVKSFEDAGFKKLKQFFYYQDRFEGGAMSRGGNHVDFFCIHKRTSEAYNLGRNFLPKNSKPYMAYVYPVESFRNFDKLIFKGMEFNIPHNVEVFLSARYSNWQTPVSRKSGFNWLSIEQNPCLKADYVISDIYWDGRAGDYNKLQWAKNEGFIKWFIDNLGVAPDKKCLDIGGGNGLIDRYILARGVKYCETVDISERMIEDAKSVPNLICHIADIQNLSPRDFCFDKYDIIYARMVVHHLLFPLDKLFACIYDKLAPGGKFAICEGIPPDAEAIPLYKRIFELKEKRRVIEPDVIKGILEGAGFKEIKTSYYTMTAVSLNNWVAFSGIPQENKDMIIKLHREAPESWKKAYRYVHAGDDILMDFKFMYMEGIRI